MKNSIKIISIFLILSVLTFISCTSDDNDNDNIDISGKGYLKAVYMNGNLIREYSYFDNGKVKTERMYQKIFEYTYSLDTVFKIRINCTGGTMNCTNTNKYFKENENTVMKNEITKFNTLYSSSKYLFNGDCSYSSVKEYDSFGELDYRTEYEYNTNCGYSKSGYDRNNVFLYREIVTKDDNIAFDRKSEIPLLKDENRNNIIKMEYITSSGDIYEGFSYSESFIYDSNDFSISSTRIYYDGDIENYTYEYY